MHIFEALATVVIVVAPYNREFKIYDATVAKTSLKIARSSFSIYFATISVCLTFESSRNYSGTEFRGAVFCFCQLNMQILWRRRCSRVVDLKAWLNLETLLRKRCCGCKCFPV